MGIPSLPAQPRTARLLATRLAVLAAAVAAGLALQTVVAARLAEIQALAVEDVVRARGELAVLLRVGGALLFGLTTLIGVSVFASSRRALAEGKFPPSGIWSWGAARVATGAQAGRLARVGLVLGALLVLASTAGGALTWHMASVLLACRAR